MQIDRILEIANILIEEKKVTAKVLADRFGVSTRTIYRDIDTLTISGMPIEVKKGKNGGIYLVDGYKINKSFLTTDERKDLLNIVNCVKKLDFLETNNVITKLGALFSDAEEDWIELDFFEWGTTSKTDFHEYKNCILNKRIVKIGYCNSNGENTIREIEPLKIYLKGYAWYLVAYCNLANDFRVFKTNRITSFEILNKQHNRTLDKNFIMQYEKPSVEEFEIVLKFKEEMKFKVFDEFNIKNVKVDPNGDIIVKTLVSSDKWLINYLLGYGEYLEVIEPKWLKKEIVNTLEKTLKIYKK